MLTSIRRSLQNPVRASLLAILAGLSCSHLVDPALPPDAELFSPPTVYAGWWSMMESCSGITRPLGNVHWFVSSTPLRNPANSAEPVEAYYSLASNRIVIGSTDTLDGSAVRHEMLHALLQGVGHPRSAFLQNCGGVVFCGSQCVRDAGPATTPDPATPSVAPSELEVTTAVSPAAPSLSAENGMFTFTISVRNPFAHPVVALLPAPAGGSAVSYPYEIRSTEGDGVTGKDFAFDPSVTYFAAGETKRHVFDFAVSQSGFTWFYGYPGLGETGVAFYPSTYSFRGAYGDKWAADLSVVLSP